MQRLVPRLVALASLAAPSLARAEWNTNSSDAVIGGYDVVGYHTDRRAVRGSSSHAHTYRGGTFWFASEAHRAAFAEDPARYVPAYGGYCAYAMAQGRRARVDPNAWTIVRGRLYLNYSIDIRRRWSEDRDAYIRSANEQWPRLRR